MSVDSTWFARRAQSSYLRDFGSYLVFEVQLLEQNTGFDAIGRVDSVQGDVGGSLGTHFDELLCYSSKA